MMPAYNTANAAIILWVSLFTGLDWTGVDWTDHPRSKPNITKAAHRQ